MEKVSIVMPAHNEENRIGFTLREYSRFFKNLKKEGLMDFEILVVLNACKDHTREVIEKCSRDCEEILFLDFEQSGKGFAITEGFKDALKRDNDFIGFVDADMATRPKYFYDLVKKVDGCQGVLASRWLKDSIIMTKQPILRIIMSRGFNFLVKSILLMPFEDTQCGAKLFKREALVEVVDEIGTTKWAYDIDLVYRLMKKGFVIKEIPTVWEDIGGSTLNVKKVPFQMFASIIRLRLLHSPFRFIVRFYNKLPEKIRIHNW